MKYDIDYLTTHDIDWFCIVNGIYIHVASAGGMLPDTITDRDELRQMQYGVSNAEYIFSEDEIEYNKTFLNTRFKNEESRADYIRTFTEMARKGFVSLDRTNWQNPNDNTYHIVCRPSQKHQREIHIGFTLPHIYQIDEQIFTQGVAVEGINLWQILNERIETVPIHLANEDSNEL